MPKTLYDKIWEKHVVLSEPNKPSLIYVDLHLVIDTSSPQAFEKLRLEDRKVRRPDLTIATVDHSIPTTDRHLPIKDNLARGQVEALSKNCEDFGIKLFDKHSKFQGIVHVISPELGLTQPGQIIVCGDSHTSTHGSFGALAFGIGTSEVEHVLATQSLYQYKTKSMEIKINNTLPIGTTSKDLILYIIGKYGTDFANGYTVEYRGEVIQNLSMEERMTLCNMSIEMGARAGLIAPDDKTYDYIAAGPFAPKGEEWEKALNQWRNLYTDEGAKFDKSIKINAHDVAPQVTWGTNPSMTISINQTIPNPDDISDPEEKLLVEKALQYMDLQPNNPIKDLSIDIAFIGSCTNSRIEDLRIAAKVVKGHKKAATVRAIVVPGSQRVKQQAEKEGLDIIFKIAGFEWREPGCSMCIGMNGDEVPSGKRCASTSNRNFEGRQGRNARTHLVSPAMAAAAAIAGHFVDIRQFIQDSRIEIEGDYVYGSFSKS